MSNYKILVKITGSIAAYKSAVLISRLVQNGCEVKTVVSDYALRFVGATTFEALTGNPVYTDSFAPRQVMSHIDLVKWADLTILCPATANTINKMANGIADNLLTSLFLAHDFSKPYLVAPAMNTLMYNHPTTQGSLSKLAGWGVQVLPVAKGYLACGDTGSGKLLEPDEIYQYIVNALNIYPFTGKPKKILITSGGTRENIDDIRYISNVSTGKTGAALADHLLANKHELTFIHSKGSAQPNSHCNKIAYTTFNELDEAIKQCLSADSYDMVIHLAAVSDYYPASVSTGNTSHNLPLQKKLDSSTDTINITFKKHEKIVNHIKTFAKSKELLLVAFKFTNRSGESERMNAIRQLFDNSGADMVVSNDFSDRTDQDRQTNFTLYDRHLKATPCQDVKDLFKELQKKLIPAP